jgi:hypothetical protein
MVAAKAIPDSSIRDATIVAVTESKQRLPVYVGKLMWKSQVRRSKEWRLTLGGGLLSQVSRVP